MSSFALPRRSHRAVGILLLFALPFLLLAANRSWIMTPAGWSDGWAYFGYFTNLPAMLSAFPAAYNGSRLAWILPGAAIHGVLPAGTANYVLHVGVYLVAILGMFAATGRLAGWRSALLVCLLAGTYTPILRAVGWHYVDGAGLAYYTAALACVLMARRSRHPWLAIIAAGAAWGGAIHSNIAWVLTAPALAAVYAVTARRRVSTFIRDAAGAAAGLAAITLTLAAAAMASGGRALFFYPTLAYGMTLVQRSRAYEQDSALWWDAAPILGPAGIVLALLFLPRRQSRRATRVARYQLAAIVGVLVAADLSGRTLLQNHNYLPMLLPATAVGLAALLRGPLRRLTPAQFASLIAMSVVVLITPLAPAVGRHLAGNRGVAIGCAVILTAIAVGRTRFTAWTTAAVALTCAGLLNASTSHLTLRFVGPEQREHEYLAITDGAAILRRLDPDLDAWFWYPQHRRLGGVFQSVAATRLWGYRLIGTSFPSLANPLSGRDAPVGPGQLIAILTEDDETAAAAATLGGLGLIGTPVHRERIQRGSVAFHLSVLRTAVDARQFSDPTELVMEMVGSGSWHAPSARIAIDAEGGSLDITTARGTFDEQIKSTVIPLVGRHHLLEYSSEVIAGGGGLHVIGADTKTVLASTSWCHPRVTREGLLFSTASDPSGIMIVLTNCGIPRPTASRFSIRALRIRTRLTSGDRPAG